MWTVFVEAIPCANATSTSVRFSREWEVVNRNKNSLPRVMNLLDILLMEEIPNNNLGCLKPYK